MVKRYILLVLPVQIWYSLNKSSYRVILERILDGTIKTKKDDDQRYNEAGY